MTRRQQLHRPGPPEGPPADDTGCGVLHVDMDAFFASVELLDHPELRGHPVIVGGGGNRGVVTSATYEARRFGVHSAMPMTRARRLCPSAVVLPPNHETYTRVSGAVMRIFREITPLVEPLALDEAFLDVSGSLRRLGRPARIGEMIRAQVAEQAGITCSVGIASTKFVAKLATTQCKPDGLLVVPEADVLDFLHPLPIAALSGVGERTEEALTRLGLRTVGDLARVPVDTLQREFGAVGSQLAALAWGRDPRPVVSQEPDRSIGAEETFPRDVDDPALIRRELLRLAEKTAARLRSAGRVGRTVSIKLRFANFRTVTRSRTLHEHTDVAQEIYTTGCALYDGLKLDRARIRLVGVRIENLSEAASTPRQLMLGERPASWREAERAIDRAARRFGSGVVRPAALVRDDEDEDL